MQSRSPVSLEKATGLLLQSASAVVDVETLPLTDAVKRVAAKPVVARTAQPPFDRSPLDGYALHHADLDNVTAAAPALLPVSQLIHAGDAPAPLRPHSAARIMTGAPLPPGADCVVRQEETDMGADVVAIRVRHERYQNVVFKGEFVRPEQMLAIPGMCSTTPVSPCWPAKASAQQQCTDDRALPSCPPGRNWPPPGRRPVRPGFTIRTGR
ncbi:MAG: hypothetical protein LIQ31_02530 [Planctomycetes bacterium]|nr:hypothetical protein [Planctomycetota bacterium]